MWSLWNFRTKRLGQVRKQLIWLNGIRTCLFIFVLQFQDIGPVDFAIEMTEGQLIGLSSLIRSGDSSITYNHGHMATILADMTIQNINITYHMNFEGGPLR